MRLRCQGESSSSKRSMLPVGPSMEALKKPARPSSVALFTTSSSHAFQYPFTPSVMTVIERGSSVSIVMTGDPGSSLYRGEVKDQRPVRSFLSFPSEPDRGVCLTFVSSPASVGSTNGCCTKRCESYSGFCVNAIIAVVQAKMSYALC